MLREPNLKICSLISRQHIYAMAGGMFLVWTVMPHVFFYYINKYRMVLDENQPEE